MKKLWGGVMHCTELSTVKKISAVRFLTTIVLALSLCACSGLQKTVSPTDGEAAEQRTKNPYLQDAQRVPQQARAAMDLAHQSFQANDLTTAESQLLQITEKWPVLSGAWLNLAIVQQSADKYAEAEQSFRQAISVNDNNIFAWNHLAALMRDRGRFEDAEQCYKAAIERWPHYIDAHRNLGILYDLYLQKPERALQHYLAAQDASIEQDKLLNAWILELERRL
ncbi:tetratricopeptide repeat protein [Microbulbifer sp. TRSA001]|uniref:tetratricopeptide repeat protein n=1 Tax=Microbulbifer sp. TRSA001 TaxID=3243381 RepID=UPI0040390602